MKLKMKVKVAIATLAIAMMSFSGSANYVYICTGGSAKKYHATQNCRGLNRCKGEVVKVSVEDAKSKGRTACKICF